MWHVLFAPERSEHACEVVDGCDARSQALTDVFACRMPAEVVAAADAGRLRDDLELAVIRVKGEHRLLAEALGGGVELLAVDALRAEAASVHRGRRVTRRDELAGGQEGKGELPAYGHSGRPFLKRERPGGGALRSEWPKRTRASWLISVRPSRLLPLLECRRSGGRGEDARVAVLPADSKALRLLLQHLTR
jgi:hypothetical protein